METKQIVDHILNTLESGWNNASGAEFAIPFAVASEFVDIRGTLHANATAQQIGQEHQGLFMSIYKDSKVVYIQVQSTLIDHNTIIAHANTELDAPVGPLAGKNGSTVSMVIIREGDQWKIRSFHNTLKLK
jgi:uncharacterized protein (TIGR02246 family)